MIFGILRLRARQPLDQAPKGRRHDNSLRDHFNEEAF